VKPQRAKTMRPPAAVGVMAGLAALFLLLPLVALALRTPWAEIGPLLGSERVRSALRVSLVASSASLALATVLGIPLAWVLARADFPGKQWLRAFATLPMVLPPVVGGVALLLAYGRRGLLGEPLADITA
jgi:molybdate transport system permease protein